MKEWDRQPTEPPAEFGAFCRYRETNSSSALKEAALDLRISDEDALQLSLNWRWRARAVAYQKYQKRIAEKPPNQMREMVIRHADLATRMLAPVWTRIATVGEMLESADLGKLLSWIKEAMRMEHTSRQTLMELDLPDPEEAAEAMKARNEKLKAMTEENLRQLHLLLAMLEPESEPPHDD